MELKIHNEIIKRAIAFEAKHAIYRSGIKAGAAELRNATPENQIMSVLWGYVKSLHEVSEWPEVRQNIDLTYKTVKNVLPALVWEFNAGMNSNSGYSTEKNIEIAEKTMAAYFMLLAINDDTAELVMTPQPILADVGKTDSWSGFQVSFCNRISRCNLLKELHGSVAYTDGLLTIRAEKLIQAYKNITGKDLRDFGVDSVQAEL